MQDIEYLMSDEFVAFSTQIAELHTERKEIKQKLKAYYETIQVELKDIDDRVIKVAADFEEWKNNQVSTQSVKLPE